jgi:Kef-type K+ transport system membrane component KefB
MRRALALLLLLATAWMVRSAAGDDAGLRGTPLALGFALIAAALAGDLFERIRLPRITGYLIFGMLCGPYVFNIITRSMARELQIINGLAIALIAFIAGLELNLSRLRARLAAIAWMSGVLLSVMYGGLFAVLWAAWPWLPIAPEASGLARMALVGIVTIIVVSFSPTVTIAVITDSRARGPLSEVVLSVVVLADLLLIVFFTLAMQFVRWTLGGIDAGDVSLLGRLSWEIFGSFAYGAALGALFAFYLRGIGRELTVVLIALCVVLSEFGRVFQFEPLLAALAAGLVVENIAPPKGDALKEAVERGALPVLVVFFAAAGTSLHLDALATVGLVALLIAAVRIVFIRLGTELGTRRTSLEPEVGRYAWMGLVSQAGVTLGLTIIVASEFPEWGVPVQTLMVALISIHELVGPVLFKSALGRAGEIGRMDEEAGAAAAAAVGAG